MCANRAIIQTDEDLVRAVNNVIKILTKHFIRSRYKPDIESIVWDAAATMMMKKSGEKTEALLYVISFRNVCKEIDEMRKIYMVDPQETAVFDEDDDDIDFDDIDFSCLTDEERMYIDWYINDGLNQTDIAELTGKSQASICRKFKAIISKLKENNL